MTARSQQTFQTRRGETVVCLAAGDLKLMRSTLGDVVRHTPPDVAIVVYGGRDVPTGALKDEIAALALEAGRSDSAGITVLPTASLQEVAARVAPADLVVVAPGCRVAPQWLTLLRAAAGDDVAIATASALTMQAIDAAALEAPAQNGGLAFGGQAARIVETSQRIRPRLDAPDGPCVLIHRSAMELAGAPMTTAFAHRCVELGLTHVLADDVLVDGQGGLVGSLPGPGPAARAAGAARRALGLVSVAIDARILAGPPDGTRRHVLELIAAVAATGEAQVTALVPTGLEAGIRARLSALPGVRLITLDTAGGRLSGPRVDVVHRPHQISSPADLTVLAGLADRLVVTHQDLISFHNPSYFASEADWENYRDLTRRALAVADRVLFFSRHVRDDALAEELVEAHRVEVVNIGADHAQAPGEEPSAPSGAEAIAEQAEVILCLGTDFQHKNRMFVLRVVAELQRRHAWTGRLVLAGPHVAHGSSRGDEGRRLAQDPALASAVIEFAAITEAEKEWLLRRAALVAYPTVHEGFGLIPYEAAAHQVPCLWAPGTALSELLPNESARIVAWDPAATADHAVELMRDEAARAANLEAIGAAAVGLSWEATGRRLVEVYRAVCDAAPSPAAGMERTAGLMRGGLSEDAMRLVGPGGALARDLERPLLALLARPRLAKPVGAAMKAGYRAFGRR